MDIYKPLAALLAIVNPIGAVPLFIHFTQGFTRAQRQRTIRVSAFSAFMVMILAALGVEIMSDGLVKLLPILAGRVR